MARVDVHNQTELDAALARGDYPRCMGDNLFVIGGSATVRAGGSATVRAWDSATVRAWDSATVEAGGSATVEAGGSATVEAGGSATVRAGDSATVRAGKYVAVTMIGLRTKVVGGVQIQLPTITTAAEWCDFYGVSTDAEVVTLYKVVDREFRSSHGFSYVPGTTPEAPDWDGGERECGGGLHFAPSTFHADRWAAPGWWPHQRYVACPVLLSDIVVHKNAQFPDKVKAPRCAGPVYEVDRNGQPVSQQEGGTR